MTLRPLLPFIAAAALLAPVLASRAASAEEPDRARFRGGVAVEGGSLIAPGVLTVGIAGVQGQIGAQINNLVGVYAVPSFDIVFGKVGGVNLSSAILVDFTFNDLLTVGVGPDLGVFAAIGVDKGGTGATAAGGSLYGARLHFSVNPVVGRPDENPVRRKALSIGVDLRLMAGGAGYAKASQDTTTVSATNFVFSPMLTIGYQAF